MSAVYSPSHIRLDLTDAVGELRPGSTALMSVDDYTHVAVFFVHGFSGHPVKTWNRFVESILAAETSWWIKVDAYFLGYESTSLDIAGATEVIANALRTLLPAPPASLTHKYFKGRAYTARGAFADYDTVYLVGHSLGGVVIRNVVRTVLRDELNNRRAHDPKTTKDFSFPEGSAKKLLSEAKLKLFAPAIGGARTAGLLGVIDSLRISGLALGASRSFKELTENTAILKAIRKETTTLARYYPQLDALRADIGWADNDNVVTAVEYALDPTGLRFPNTTHSSLCKPNEKYRKPVDFIEGTITRPSWS